MSYLITKTNDNQEEYFHFDPLELHRILHLGAVNGWSHCVEDPYVFSKEASEGLCAALEKEASALEAAILSDEDLAKEKDKVWVLMQLIMRKQLKLVDDFLSVCEGNPFRIEFENENGSGLPPSISEIQITFEERKFGS